MSNVGVPGVSTASVACRAVGLGLATGGRSTSAVAAFAVASQAGPRPRDVNRPASMLSGPGARKVGVALLLTELVVDKLPSTPSRLAPPVLGIRVAAAVLVSWALAQREHVPPAMPVVAGAVGAFAGSIAGARYRAATASRGVPDVSAALLEDAATLLLARVGARA